MSSRILDFVPKLRPSREPIIDDLTWTIAGAIFYSRSPELLGTKVRCPECGGEVPKNTLHHLRSGHSVDAMGLHLIAYHRGEVPENELEIIRSLDERPAPFLVGERVAPPIR
jgi:hypothetical protein